MMMMMILFNIKCKTLYKYTSDINTKTLNIRDTKGASSNFHCGPCTDTDTDRYMTYVDKINFKKEGDNLLIRSFEKPCH